MNTATDRPAQARRSARAGTAVAAILLFAGAAGAVTSGSFKYPDSKTAYRMILPASLFATDSKSIERADIQIGALTGVACLNSGVNFPGSARLESIEVFYSSSVADSIAAALFQNDLETGAVSSLAAGSMPDGTETRTSRLLDIAGSVKISNNRNSYTFNLCLNDRNDIFYGARIKYHYKSAGD